MKSKKTMQTITSQKTMQIKQPWKQDLQDQLYKIKRPFLNRVEYSKLKIESKISDFKQEKEVLRKYQGLIQCLVQKLLQNKLHPVTQQKSNTQQSENEPTQKYIRYDSNKQNKMMFDQESEDEKQSEVPVDYHFTEWQGRDRERVFKNSTNMQEQFDKVFNKKLGMSHSSKKRESYSYRKEEKQMLEKVYNELKDPSHNDCVTFQRMYKFFDDCKLFFTVYGITNNELQDIVSCSAHKYPDRLTKKEFLELFLVNTQSRTYDELENKVEKKCCMEEDNWNELRNLFNQLDTFGRGTIKMTQFFHKMKTVSASKQLIECKTIYFTNINRYYTFNKVLFELEHKMKVPQEISWTDLKNLISNFSHIELPTLDEISQKQIMAASIFRNETNTFLLKEDTLKLLKEEFSRCPKFSQHFVKCKYFCDELMSLEGICSKTKELVRNSSSDKGFVNLLGNIRMLHLQGPQYFDMDEMLTYFSVKGFQTQIKEQKQRISFDAQSTTSEEEWQERKKEERRGKRMKSLDQMDKIMKKMNVNKNEKEEKPSFKPVVIQEFNLTKTRDHMTIRQRKVKQMIEQKQRKELSQIKPYIPANPIPASCNGQRYLDEQAKQLMKRELEKERRQKQREEDQKKIKHLMSNTKLFEKRDPFLIEEQKKKFMSPQPKQQFEAKPISWFIKERNLLSVIQSEKEQKRKNRLRQTKQKYVFGYWKQMPYDKSQSNFKKMTIIKNLQTCKDTDESLQLEIQNIVEMIDTQKNSKPKVGVVPDFTKLQKEFLEQLQSKKKMRGPTVVKEFNLSVPKKREPELILENYLKKTSPQKMVQKNPQNSRTQQPVIVGTTKKFQSMMELTQRKMSLKRYEAQLEELQEKQRKKKEKIFAKFMKKAMKEQAVSKQKTESMKSTRIKNDQSIIDHEKDLRKMYERVLNRPFLFQSASESQQMRKKGRKSAKQSKRRQEPKKVIIPGQQPNDRAYPTIPQLNYIQEEQQYLQDGDYDKMNDEGPYVVRDFDEDSEEYDDQDEYEESHQKNTRNNQLNQSF